jgi:hypothetical protein
MMHSKIEGHPDLIRDTETNAILNSNRSEYEKYLLTAQIKKLQQTKVEKIEEELDILKDDMTEIKELLKTVLSKFQ